jgi:hypothetical protein
MEAEFDARPWFEQAADDEIQALARCGWGGDDPADAVAAFCSDRDDALGRLFLYLSLIRDGPSKKDCCRFECHVDPGQALAWVREHRPSLAVL